MKSGNTQLHGSFSRRRKAEGGSEHTLVDPETGETSQRRYTIRDFDVGKKLGSGVNTFFSPPKKNNLKNVVCFPFFSKMFQKHPQMSDFFQFVPKTHQQK